MNRNDNIYIGVPTTTPDIFLMTTNNEPNTIQFTLNGEVVIKVNSDGFFWRGNLVETDKEIYERFKEFLEISEPPKPKAFNNDIYESTISLLKQALLFYSNPNNYIGDSSPMAFDKGFQAKYALQQITQLEIMQATMAIDYSNLKIEEPLTNIEDITQIIKDNL